MSRVALLGDGGSEVIAAARRALAAVADLDLTEAPAGCAAVLSDRPLPDLARALGHHAALLAVRPAPALIDASPLRGGRIAHVDLVLVRDDARVAFEAAERRRGRLAAVGSAETVDRLAAAYPDVAVEHIGEDDAASALIAEPSRFDVFACDGAAGAALAGLAAAITGTPGMLPGATLGARPPGIFSPPMASGSAATANPLPVILAAALLLREGLGLESEAERLEVAVEQALETGLRTPDLILGAEGERRAGTEALTAAVIAGLAHR